MVSLIWRSALPCRSTSVTLSSNPSLLTRTENCPACKSGMENRPDPSEATTRGCGKLLPVSSIRAPATTAPEGSFTVPEMVSATTRVEHSRQRNATASVRHLELQNRRNWRMGSPEKAAFFVLVMTRYNGKSRLPRMKTQDSRQNKLRALTYITSVLNYMCIFCALWSWMPSWKDFERFPGLIRILPFWLSYRFILLRPMQGRHGI